MRNLLLWVAVAGAVGCGLTEENFWEDYEDKYCADYSACAGSTDCPIDGVFTTDGTQDGCEFDKSAARTCLDADWECTEGAVVIDPACATVCGKNTSDTDE